MALIASIQDDLSGRGMSAPNGGSSKDPYMQPSGPVSPMADPSAGAPPMPHDMKPMSAKADYAQGLAMATPYAQPYSPAAFAQPGFQAAPMSPMQTPAWSQDSCTMPQMAMSPGSQLQMMQQQKLAQLQMMKMQNQQGQAQPQKARPVSASPITTQIWMIILAWVIALIVIVLIVVGFAYIIKTYSRVNYLVASAQGVGIA